MTATGGLTGANSSSFTVSPAGANHLAWSLQPNSTTAGTTLAPVAVEVYDSFGNALTSDNTDTVTLTIARGPRGFAGSSTTLAPVNHGVATFSNMVLDGAGSYTLKAMATSGMTAAQSVNFTISPATVYSFVVIPAQNEVTAGTGFTVTILAKDVYGNTVTSYAGGKVALSCSDGQAVAPSSVTLNKGAASPAVTLATPDSVYLTATAGSIRGTSSSIMVDGNGPNTDPSYVYGVYSFALFVYDIYGNLIEPPLTSAFMTPDDAQATAFSTPSTIAQNNAQAQTFISDQESILGEQFAAQGYDVGMITTTDPNTGTTSVTQTPVGQDNPVLGDFTVSRNESAQGSPGSAVNFALTTPVYTQADAAQAVTVTALDSNGNVVTKYTGTVSLGSTDPQFGQPISYTFTSADQGRHSFTVNLDTAGVQALTATAGGSGTLTGQAIESEQMVPLDSGSSAVNGQGLVDITPAPAGNLVLDAPNTITAGSMAGITVTALDAFGNVATGYTGTVSFLNNGNATMKGLPSSYTFAPADHGSHLFAVSFKTTGTMTMNAADGKDSLISQQSQVQIMPAPAKLVIKSQPPTVVTPGNYFGLVVEAVNNQGKLAGDFNGLVSMTLSGNPVHGTLGGVMTVQAVNGVATFAGLALTKAGAGYSLRATSGSVTTATTRALSVTASTASRFVLITQPPSKVSAASPFGLKVAAEDDYGNVITSFTGSVTLALASGPSGATLGGKLTMTLVKGVATFSGLRITQAGSGYSLTASGGSLAAATTNLFTVSAGTATQLAITTQPPSSVTAGSAFGLVVTALDAYGNVAGSFTGKVTLSLASNPGLSTLTGQVTVQAVNGVITFTDLLLDSPGSGYRLKATSGSLMAETDDFSVAG